MRVHGRDGMGRTRDGDMLMRRKRALGVFLCSKKLTKK